MARFLRSLRWRLQIWNALILAVVVVGFSLALRSQFHRLHWAHVDDELVACARIVEGVLRQIPRPILDSLAQDLDFQPGPANRNGPPGRRPPIENPRPRPPRDRAPPNKTIPPFRSAEEPDDWWLLDEFGPGNLESKPERQWLAELQFPDRLPQPPGRRESPTYYVVWRADKSIVHQFNLPDPKPPTLDPADSRFERQRYVVVETGEYRNIYIRGPRQTVLCVGRSVSEHQDEEYRGDVTLALTALSVYGVGLLGGFALSRKATKPIESMTQTVELIGPQELHRRMNLTNVDAELARLGQVLNGMLDRLETSFQQQQQFTADASHELRTPLSVMLSATEHALSRERSAADYREQLEVCNRSARRMHNLVDSLLMLARVDANAVGQQFEACDLKTIVSEQLEEAKILAEQKNISIEHSLSEAQIPGIPSLLARIVMNLMHNAIQYTPAGGRITIGLAKEFSASHKPVARLTVSDNGEGIPEKDLPHIFDRFYRVDRARSRQTGGSGLGLAICRAIVRFHGGSIQVRSQAGQGTTFVIELPMTAAASPAVKEP